MAKSTKVLVALALCSSLQLLNAAPAPRFTIDGNPVFGSFAYTWEIDYLRQALDSGINLVFCYKRGASAQLLDPNSEMGRLVLERRAKVMANLCFAAGGKFLAEDVTAEATTIQLNLRGDRKGPGTFWIGDEAVRFETCQKGKLQGCQRGWAETTPASHPKRLHVVHEEPLKNAIVKIKDSANLWGYWIMDDKKGNQRDALRNVYRIIKKTDRDQEGHPNPHVVVAGMSNPDALTNFDANTCDMAGIYIYPAHRDAFNTTMTGEQLKEMLALMSQRSPETPFMGIYQAFTAPKWKPKPKPLQVRKQITDFAHFGAAALMAYSWRMVPGAEALRDLPDLRAEVKQLASDLVAGRILLDQSPPEYADRPAGTPDLSVLSPVLSFDKLSPDTAFSANKNVITTELAPGPDDAQWLHLRFTEYAEGAPQWPSVRLEGAKLRIPRDWSGAGWLVAEVHNFLAVDSEIGITVRDSRDSPWWARYFPLPAGRTTKVHAPASILARTMSLSDVTTVTLLMRRPPAATHLGIRALSLAPAQFGRANSAQATASRAAVPPSIDGLVTDPCWQGVSTMKLQDEVLLAPPLQPVTAKAVRIDNVLHLLVESVVRDPQALHVSTEPVGPWEATDDTIVIILRNPRNGRWLRHVVNSAGLTATRIYNTNEVEAQTVDGDSASGITQNTWTLEASFGLETLAAVDAAELELNIRRHDRQLGPLIWARDDRLPNGLTPIGLLRLQR